MAWLERVEDAINAARLTAAAAAAAETAAEAGSGSDNDLDVDYDGRAWHLLLATSSISFTSLDSLLKWHHMTRRAKWGFVMKSTRFDLRSLNSFRPRVEPGLLK